MFWTLQPLPSQVIFDLNEKVELATTDRLSSGDFAIRA
jgi:hypothetical protein